MILSMYTLLESRSMADYRSGMVKEKILVRAWSRSSENETTFGEDKV